MGHMRDSRPPLRTRPILDALFNRDKNTATRRAPSAVDRDFLVALRKHKDTIGKLFGIDPGFVENWVSSLPQLIPARNEAAHQDTPEMILLALRTKKDPAKPAFRKAGRRTRGDQAFGPLSYSVAIFCGSLECTSRFMMCRLKKVICFLYSSVEKGF
jgi:hypothetical protein